MNESNKWGMNDEQDEQDEDKESRKSRKDHKPKFFCMKNNNDNANEKWNDWDDNNNNEWANMNKLFEVE